MQVQKTYSEREGHSPINWNERINKIISGEVEYGSMEHNVYMRDSGQWVTCACGNMCEIIPRNTNGVFIGSPSDGTLFSLGIEFHAYITKANGPKAKNVLRKIEERSEFLIKEELKKTIHVTS